MDKKVIMITSGQPSLNPRLVKEADALSISNYDVTVLYAYWNDWATRFDEQLLKTKKWKAIRVGGHPTEKPFTYLFSRIIFRLANWFFKTLRIKHLADLALTRSSYFLMNEVKKHKAAIYIAHNLGALPAAIKAAKYHKSQCGFDAEDFHRYEANNDKTNPDVILKSFIENRYIPQTNYFTASSQPIADAYYTLFPTINPVVIINAFPKSSTQTKKVPQDSNLPLKLFWFSQTIGNNRGIIDVVKALQILNSNNFELHLLGDRLPANQSFIAEINNYGINIKYHDLIPSDQLIPFAAQFDIGLALEPGFCINNDYALSNKIFTYMQAGLAVIASNTNAQKSLIGSYPAIGKIYLKGNAESLSSILDYYNKNRDELVRANQASLKLAHEKLNWEIESQKFLKVVADTLSS